MPWFPFFPRRAARGLRLSVRVLRLFCGGLVLAGLVACSSVTKDPTVNWSADRLYAEAKDEMASGNWAAAIGHLQKLESRYPFGRFAQQAQIDTAYSYWKDNELGLALATLDRFQRLYPNHENLDYVLYLRGLINFNDRPSLFTQVTGEDLAERDPKAAREAFDTFKELVQRFPESRYAPDAEARLQFLLNTLAQNDTHVARFYIRRGAYMAAVNRAQQVVRSYQSAPAVEEALAQMVHAYEKLGLDTYASDTRRVLAKNFPQSHYLERGYNPELRFGLPSQLVPKTSSGFSVRRVFDRVLSSF